MLSFTEFTDAVITVLALPKLDCQPDTGLFSDLDLDSFQSFHLLILIEELADVMYVPDDFPPLFSLGDAYDYYLALAEFARGEGP